MMSPVEKSSRKKNFQLSRAPQNLISILLVALQLLPSFVIVLRLAARLGLDISRG